MLGAVLTANDETFLQAYSEDYDQTVRISCLIRYFTGRMP